MENIELQKDNEACVHTFDVSSISENYTDAIELWTRHIILVQGYDIDGVAVQYLEGWREKMIETFRDDVMEAAALFAKKHGVKFDS